MSQKLAAKLQTAIAMRKNDEGATAVEYGLMVALIAGVIILAVTAIGTNLNTVFNGVAGKLTFSG